MKRRQISFDESCGRPCALRLTQCGGPTASGLDGYVCENCLTYIDEKFESGKATGNEPCRYCSETPTYTGVQGGAICGPCTKKSLDAAKYWYELRDDKNGA